jgi:hypothetical protein
MISVVHIWYCKLNEKEDAKVIKSDDKRRLALYKLALHVKIRHLCLLKHTHTHTHTHTKNHIYQLVQFHKPQVTFPVFDILHFKLLRSFNMALMYLISTEIMIDTHALSKSCWFFHCLLLILNYLTVLFWFLMHAYVIINIVWNVYIC